MTTAAQIEEAFEFASAQRNEQHHHSLRATPALRHLRGRHMEVQVRIHRDILAGLLLCTTSARGMLWAAVGP